MVRPVHPAMCTMVVHMSGQISSPKIALILRKLRTHLKTIYAVIRDYYYSSSSSYVRLMRVFVHCECDPQR